jgi:tripeptidyl-peptidase-1
MYHLQGVELLFAVRQTNLSLLESTLMKVSDPSSGDYGKHLSNDEVHAMVRPKPEHVRAVHSFLAEHGVKGHVVSPNSDFIRADVSVAQAERMFSGTEYHELAHSDVAHTIHRCLNYSLPAAVAAAVDFVAPTVHVPAPNKRTTQTVRGDDDDSNTPKHLRSLYKIDAEGTAPNNSMAVTAFLAQNYESSDLQNFWKTYCDGNIA